MTNKQIKKAAVEYIKDHVEVASAASLYVFATVIFSALVEIFVCICIKLINADSNPFSISYYLHSKTAVVFLVLRLCVYYVLIATQTYLARRYFVNFTDGVTAIDRYLSVHIYSFLPGAKNSFKLAAYKLLVLSPISVGIYGIHYQASLSQTGEITIFGLVCFMLSTGFTIVWLGICIHYFMSLTLVKYIAQLNPRVNFFDACDLSVKLMEGKHYRLFCFYVSLLPYLLALFFVYPIVFVYPFLTECHLLMAKDLMGNLWQDKLPAMARRWERQQIRKTEQK